MTSGGLTRQVPEKTQPQQVAKLGNKSRERGQIYHMTATTLDTLIATHGSLLALSRHLLGDEWSRGRYQTLAAQVAAGELSGWVAACVAAHAELEELRATVAAIEKTGSAAE